MSVQVEQQADRFVATRDGAPAGFLTYRDDGTQVVLTHTVVEPEHEGHGVGSALAEAAVGWAEREGRRLDVRCSYVRGWLERHR
jgi:uncharacterized protein